MTWINVEWISQNFWLTFAACTVIGGLIGLAIRSRFLKRYNAEACPGKKARMLRLYSAGLLSFLAFVLLWSNSR